MSATLQCPGNISTNLTTGYPSCVDASGGVLAWVVVPEFDPSQLDAPSVASSFAAGFVLVGISYAIGKAAGLVLKAILM